MKIKNLFSTILVLLTFACTFNAKAQHDLDVDNLTNCDVEISIMFIDCCCNWNLSTEYTVSANTFSNNYPSPYTCGRAFYVHIIGASFGINNIIGDPKGGYTCNTGFPDFFDSSEGPISYRMCSAPIRFNFTPATPTTNAKLTIY